MSLQPVHAITEFAALQLKPSVSLSTHSELNEHFCLLGKLQATFSSYPLLFFVDVSDPSIVYLISGWKDIAHHYDWIRGDENQTLLKIFEPFLTIKEFAHLDMDFLRIPEDVVELALIRGVDLETLAKDEKKRCLGIGKDIEHPEKDGEFMFVPVSKQDSEALVHSMEQPGISTARLRRIYF